MKPILYQATETEFTNQGLGTINAISCEVEEELNGAYTLTLTTDDTESLVDSFVSRNLILAKVSDGSFQPFRIEEVSRDLSGNVTIYANHISYDLGGVPLKPFSATGITATLNGFKNNSMISHPFTLWSNITNTSSRFNQLEPNSYRGQLGGVQGSLLDVFGGEYEFDRFTVKLHNRRGKHNVSEIRYGLNLTEAKQEENIASTYTGVVAYWTDDAEGSVLSDVQYIDNHQSFGVEKIYMLDASQDFEEKPTKAQLNTRANQYIVANRIGEVKVNLSLNYVDLSTVENFKDKLPRTDVGLGDTLTVDFGKFGRSSGKVIHTVWNVIEERWETVEIGDTKSSLAQTLYTAITEQKNEVEAVSRNAQAQNQLAKLMANSLGFFETRVQTENGGSIYYYHDKPTLSASTVIYTFNENGFAVSQDGGKTYKAGFDSSGNAVLNVLDVIGINADWINAGTLSGIEIQNIKSDGTIGLDIKNGVVTFLKNGTAFGQLNTAVYQGDNSDAIVMTANRGNSISLNYQSESNANETLPLVFINRGVVEISHAKGDTRSRRVVTTNSGTNITAEYKGNGSYAGFLVVDGYPNTNQVVIVARNTNGGGEPQIQAYNSSESGNGAVYFGADSISVRDSSGTQRTAWSGTVPIGNYTLTFVKGLLVSVT